jgi:hypothetical protein
MKSLAHVVGACTLAFAGCDDGTTSTPMADAPAGAAPTVMVTAPNGGEAFYPSTTVDVRWIATGTGLHCDVELVDGGTTTPIASDVAATSGVVASAPWSIGTLAQKSTYRIRVTVTDGTGATATDTSDADFAVRAAQAVSFAGEILPIFGASCDGAQCHDASNPAESLDLTQPAAHGALVGIASVQCPSVQLVNAGNPDQSYLVWKLQGAGPCFAGSVMPKGLPLLSSTQIQLVRDWIANGAPNN